MNKYGIPEEVRELLQMMFEEGMLEASEVYMLGNVFGNDYAGMAASLSGYAFQLRHKYSAMLSVVVTACNEIEREHGKKDEKLH